MQALTDRKGEVVVQYYYEVFGQVWAGLMGPYNRYAFTGKEYDPKTGLYYFGARWYDPEVGRWTSQDPVRDGLNWYAYVGNRPTAFVDPFGLFKVDPSGQWGTVEPGDTLSGIAQEIYGDSSLYTEIVRIQPFAIPDPDRIYPGQNIILPRTQSYPQGYDLRNDSVREDWVTESLLFGGLAVRSRALTWATRAWTWVRSSIAAEGAAGVARVGHAGEAAVRSVANIGPKEAIRVAGRTRIPDGLNWETRVLSEVENVQSLSYTQQLRDFATYAQNNGLRFDLWVRPTTRLSGPLARDIANGVISLRYIP
ncbi:hypothetical protein LIP_1393 [Limnochorda pilosa]|uniref:LysM domain-containing protein n=1 Tax=Limnochorda pilosa TaxID=1555112 RepID=A0A0K2SK88_LIMPI|nr:hypothetical protein LIP_1393 [Limnochorda pilosa]